MSETLREARGRVEEPGSFVGRRYHFIGIGGIGMSSLARLLLDWGAVVSGSDRADGEMVQALRREGAAVAVGHAEKNLASRGIPDYVIYSKAIPEENPELKAARAQGVPTMHRAELLAHVMSSRTAVCICGTHGKTTTTAMLTSILVEAGKDPAVMLGGVYEPLGGNARSGRGDVFVAEACEAYGSFLSLYPDLAVITNIEPDHLDQGATFQDILDSFRTFLGRVPQDGRVIGCASSPEVTRLLPELAAPVETYSLSDDGQPGPADWTARRTAAGDWEIQRKGIPAARLRLQVPGEHNVLNALAALAAASALRVDPAESARTLGHFTGVDRRFSFRGESGGVRVVDDYAHHPSEIQATLLAAREWLRQHPAPAPRSSSEMSEGTAAAGAAGDGRAGDGGAGSGGAGGGKPARLIAAFQPHLYSRTALFMEEFASSLGEADIVVLTEIYAAREEPLPGVTGEALADQTQQRWPEKPVLFVPSLEELAEALADISRPGDLVLTLGAGDITEVGAAVLQHLSRKPGADHV